MLAFANVLDLFTHKLARLSARCFPLAFIFARAFDRLFLRHVSLPFAQVFIELLLA
jgi:hypothetical protein